MEVRQIPNRNIFSEHILFCGSVDQSEPEFQRGGKGHLLFCAGGEEAGSQLSIVLPRPPETALRGRGPPACTNLLRYLYNGV